jgi:hypothetical protein
LRLLPLLALWKTPGSAISNRHGGEFALVAQVDADECCAAVALVPEAKTLLNHAHEGNLQSLRRLRFRSQALED